MTGEVRTFVLLNREIRRAAGHLDDLLIDFYERLRKDVVAPHYTECKFYKLKNPVLVRRGHLDAARDECLRADNREELTEPITTMFLDLADDFKANYIYLAINSLDPPPKLDNGIQASREKHGALFESLRLTVETFGQWCSKDVSQNMRGGVITTTNDCLPAEFKDIWDALEKPRLYEGVHEIVRDFENAHSYEAHFSRIFASCGTGLPTVINIREFTALYNVLRCFHKDVASIDDESSPSLRATTFMVHFMHPPFFSENQSHNYEYHQEQSWRFPIFLNLRSSPNSWSKFTPKSNIMVASPLSSIPFIISEILSDNTENDRSRMLVEAIAAARAGQFLLKPTSQKRFFVVAICLDPSLSASRYIVMQTSRNDKKRNGVPCEGKEVSILRKDFNLREEEQSVAFLREMYNLEALINELAGELDKSKWRSLAGVHVSTENVSSLSMERCHKPQNLGIFGAEGIQNVLHEMNYEIRFIPWGHPQLARIVSRMDDKHGYLKFVEDGNSEVRILRYLTHNWSFSNHTISDVQFWPVQGGTLISMPVAGGWLTSLNTPDTQLWSVALQLFEAVAFMHEHNVAHMSLSPQHVLIPSNGGRLSIIDFSCAVQFDEPDAKHIGVMGTKGYIAPEVYDGGEYKPMLADLWSCGKILEELCARCGPCSTVDRKKVLEISKKLMDKDPEARPKTTSLLRWMASARNQDNASLSVVAATLSPVCVPAS